MHRERMLRTEAEELQAQRVHMEDIEMHVKEFDSALQVVLLHPTHSTSLIACSLSLQASASDDTDMAEKAEPHISDTSFLLQSSPQISPDSYSDII